MISALHDHASSADHRDVECVLKAKKHIDVEGKGSLDHGIDAMNHSEQRRIVTCMKVVYFCAVQDIPLEKYPHECKLLCELDIPNVPFSQEYGAYMNSILGREMVLSIKDHTKKMVMSEIRSSPFYSLLIDESTDRSIKKHLIVYVLYLTNAGKGSTKSAFVELLPMESGNAKDIFETLCKFIEENFVELEKLIAIVIDGASVMTGHKTGVVSRFQEILPRIMGVHCIAHRQALVAKDGFIDHPHVYAFVDKVANKVYSWLEKSSKRHAGLWKIMTEYDIMDIKALQIHGVRWLSRGRVMQRLVSIMPAILEQWSFQFMIHFLVDVLMELNELNLEFQKQEIDITTIGALIDFTFEKLTRRYLCSHILDFAISSPHLSSFLKMTTENMLAYEDVDGKVHTHVLRIEPSGSLEECISMAQTCVKNILNALNKRFEDIPIFNAFKREDFVGMLYRNAKNKSMHDAWELCRSNKSWWNMFPEMMKLWQLSLVIPASTAACERGFSRQNFIKNTSTCSLGLETLDALMFLSIDGRESSSIDWIGVFDLWMSSKKRRAMPLE
ncbi:hypothetical protein KP509_22G017300 [Ceratopteris richardii]|uniref:HAT C-terminal dimerisation domain-containing protein n=1 Tax=Ceratopteris richardii TaxID=49495 RepID=A0A8T2S326_CERRI|nr:hypothetical protein KP509_22G017300 [Ceratopteris richardii]